MKIKEISFENFRGKSSIFSPEKINLMFQPNGRGKTSLCDAIRYGITGLMPQDDVYNTKVSILFENGLKVERRRNKLTVCLLNGEKTTERSMSGAIADMMGSSLDTVKIVTSSEVFMNIRPEELLSFLLQFIPEKLDFKMTMSYFSKMSDEIRQECSLIFPSMPDTYGIAEIGVAHEYFCEERRSLRALMNNKKSIYTGLVATEPIRTLGQIEAEIIKAAVKESGSAGEIKARFDYEEAKKKRTAQEAQIQLLTQQLVAVTDQVPTDEQLKFIEDKREECQEKMKECDLLLMTTKNSISQFKEILSSLKKPKCPLSDSLVCTTDKTIIRNEMHTVLENNEESLKILTKRRNDLEACLIKCVNNRETYDRLKGKHTEFLRISAEKKGYVENLAVVPQEPKTVEGEEEHSALMQRLSSEKKNCETFLEKEKLGIEIRNYERKIELYDYIILALSDKGEVKSSIIQYYLSTFEQVCNQRAAEFAPGYEVKLLIDDGIHILAKTPGSNDFFPFNSLSTGETVIVQFIILDMLNQLSNVGILFLDNIESLDKMALGNLSRLIGSPEFQDAYDHVFICGVDHKDVITAFEGIDAKHL